MPVHKRKQKNGLSKMGRHNKPVKVTPKYPSLFGTNGIRGVVNDLMNPLFAAEMGMAIGTYAQQRDIVIGTDGRTSNQMIKNAVVSGLLSTGCDVIDIGYAPTPVVQYAVPHFQCVLGITITASHNPPKFNGIKTASSDGSEFPRAEEEQIERIFYEKSFRRVSWDNIGLYRRADVISDYIEAILSRINLPTVRKRPLKVVHDAGNGTTGIVTPEILKRMGCSVVTLNANMDGMFPAHPSEPTEQNSEQLKKAVVSLGADLGIIQDGDGDRTIFIDENGRYLPGEISLAIIARQAVIEAGGGIVVTPVNASRCVEDAIREHNGRIIYTRVGSPPVIGKMKETNAVVGGEEAGGIVHPKFQYAKDGMMTAARMIEIMAITGKKMSELADEIPSYCVYKTRVECPDERKKDVITRICDLMSSRKGVSIDRTDGVKISDSKGWILVRPSGTEPIFRVFVERKNRKDAERDSTVYVKLLRNLIGSSAE